MTERLRGQLSDLATEMPRPYVPPDTWRRGRRARRHRQLASASAVAACGLLVLAGVSGLGSRPEAVPDPARPSPTRVSLPAVYEVPRGSVQSATDAPPGVASSVVEARLRTRTAFFLTRTSGRAFLAVGPDHRYRWLSDVPDGAGGGIGALLAPDGRWVAVPAVVSFRGPGRPQNTVQYSLRDLTTGHAHGPQMACVNHTAGWTRDGWFACGEPTSEGRGARLRVRSLTDRGQERSELWTLGARSGEDTFAEPGTILASEGLALQVTDDGQGFDVIDRDGRVVRHVAHKGGEVRAVVWCSRDLVAVSEEETRVLLGLDGAVRNRYRVAAPWQPVGCRPDGHLVVGANAGTSLMGSVLVLGPGGASDPVEVPRLAELALNDVAIDALDGRVALPAATAGRPPASDWLDEAALSAGLLALPAAAARALRRRRVVDART